MQGGAAAKLLMGHGLADLGDHLVGQPHQVPWSTTMVACGGNWWLGAAKARTGQRGDVDPGSPILVCGQPASFARHRTADRGLLLSK